MQPPALCVLVSWTLHPRYRVATFAGRRRLVNRPIAVGARTGRLHGSALWARNPSGAARTKKPEMP